MTQTATAEPQPRAPRVDLALVLAAVNEARAALGKPPIAAIPPGRTDWYLESPLARALGVPGVGVAGGGLQFNPEVPVGVVATLAHLWGHQPRATYGRHSLNEPRFPCLQLRGPGIFYDFDRAFQDGRHRHLMKWPPASRPRKAVHHGR